MTGKGSFQGCHLTFPVFRGEEGGGCPHGAGGREVVLLLTAGTAQPSAQANYPPVANNIRTS